MAINVDKYEEKITRDEKYDMKATIYKKGRIYKETDRLIFSEKDEMEIFIREMELTKDTTCGIWKFKGGVLQKFANKKVFILVYGLCGLVFAATYSYFNGTISTMEKIFRVQSKSMGVVLVGNDISQLFVSLFLSYYTGKGHRLRWVAFGMYCVALFCFLCATPHFLYGPGEDALHLTKEYGSSLPGNMTSNSFPNLEGGKYGVYSVDSDNDLLCNSKAPDSDNCEGIEQEGNIIPIAIWFIAQLISGIGIALYNCIGYVYIDDNIEKSKLPGVITFTYFIRTIGPAIGYSLASIFLKFYIAPTLRPIISDSDPRWTGAWWMGWLVMGAVMTILSTIMLLFPRELPRTAAIKEFMRLKNMEPKLEPEKPSFADMIKSLKRLMGNSVYIFNHISLIFCIYGYISYYIFLPKYIETQYRQSASASNLATGSIGLVFSAIGILVTGLIIQKFKPNAKYLAFWNIIISFVTLIGLLAYSVLGCPGIDGGVKIVAQRKILSNMTCVSGCYCENVKYSPVCSVSTQETFLSPCHAGCHQEYKDESGKMIYTNCSCIVSSLEKADSKYLKEFEEMNSTSLSWGSVVSGQCSIDCQFYFYTFLAIVCILNLTGSMGRITTFLLTVRCVEERDKSMSLGIGLAALSVFALIPSPIFYGYIMDTTCLVWSKTCGQNGNCWLYDAALMRQRINYISMFFMAGAIFFDMLIWWKIPNLNLYDEAEISKVNNTNDFVFDCVDKKVEMKKYKSFD